MNRTVYIETSVISYLTSRPSTDVIKSACQKITKSWLEHGRVMTRHYISPYVVEEACQGDPTAASERLDALREIPVLPLSLEIPDLLPSRPNIRCSAAILGRVTGGTPVVPGIESLSSNRPTAGKSMGIFQRETSSKRTDTPFPPRYPM